MHQQLTGMTRCSVGPQVGDACSLQETRLQAAGSCMRQQAAGIMLLLQSAYVSCIYLHGRHQPALCAPLLHYHAMLLQCYRQAGLQKVSSSVFTLTKFVGASLPYKWMKPTSTRQHRAESSHGSVRL